MFETIIFIDGGFVSKISNYFGDGKYLRYDLISFAENICLKENLLYKQIFYYTARSREKRMYKVIQDIQKDVNEGKPLYKELKEEFKKFPSEFPLPY